MKDRDGLAQGPFSLPRAPLRGCALALACAALLVAARGAWAQAPVVPSRSGGVDVFGYSIEGGIQLELGEFTARVAPYIGPHRSAADIERARSAVQQAYRDLGFCSLRVVLKRPEPEEGVLTFALLETGAKEQGDCAPKATSAALPRPQAGCADAGPGVDGCPDARVVVNARGGATEHRVRSLRALRDAGVVKQRFDYSCGAASLATLLTYGLNDPVGEDVLLRALLEPLAADELAARQKKGFSLFDLQQLAQRRGHKALGFRVAQSQLAKLSRPVIVFIKPQGYEHFAVFKGLRGDRVHLADPSLGNVRMPLYRFLDMWADAAGRGVIFAVESASADWPQRYALQLGASSDAPLEVLSAQRLMAIGSSLPLLDLNR